MFIGSDMSKLKRCLRDLTGPTNPTTAGAMVVGGIGTTLILVTVGVAFYWIILGLISGAAIGGISSTCIANTIDKCRKNYFVEDPHLAVKFTDIFIQRILNIYIILKEMREFAKARQPNEEKIHLRQIIVIDSTSKIEQKLINSIITLHKLSNPGYYKNIIYDDYSFQSALEEFEKNSSKYSDYLLRNPKKALKGKTVNSTCENEGDLEMQVFGSSMSPSTNRKHFTFFKDMVVPSSLSYGSGCSLKMEEDKKQVDDSSSEEEQNDARKKPRKKPKVPKILSKEAAQIALSELKKHSPEQIKYIKLQVDKKIARNNQNQRNDSLYKFSV